MSALLDVGTPTLGAEIFATAQALAALLLVGALAWVAFRVLPRRRTTGALGAIEVEARLPIDLRNALVIVRVEERRLLLATSDHGPARLVTELSREATPPAREGGDGA